MPDLPPPVPAIQLSVASRGISKGLVQTDGPQVLARGLLSFGKLELGGQWKNVDASNAGGEVSLFIGGSRKLGTVQLTASAAVKYWTGSRGLANREGIELSLAAVRKFGPVSGRLSVVYSPDALGGAKQSLFVEAGPQLDLGHGWNASAAVARRHLADRPDYTAFNAGVARSLGKLTLDLRYYSTNRRSLGDAYHPGLVGTAKVAF